LESYNTDEIIAGIRSQDPNVLRYVYLNFFPEVKLFVLKNGGSLQDAKDYFQETIIIVYRKIKEGNFSVNKSFQHYLLGICKYILIEQKSKDMVNEVELSKYAAYERVPENEFEQIRKHYEYKLYQHHFRQLGQDCQKIIGMILQKIPIKVIAEEMSTTEGYIHSRKYKCKEQLITNIKSDPKFGKVDEE